MKFWLLIGPLNFVFLRLVFFFTHSVTLSNACIWIFPAEVLNMQLLSLVLSCSILVCFRDLKILQSPSMSDVIQNVHISSPLFSSVCIWYLISPGDVNGMLGFAIGRFVIKGSALFCSIFSTVMGR